MLFYVLNLIFFYHSWECLMISTQMSRQTERVLCRCQHLQGSTLTWLSPALPLLAEMKHEKTQYILVKHYSKAYRQTDEAFVVLLIFCASAVLSNCSPPWQHNFHTPAPPPPSCNPTWNAALSSSNPKHSALSSAALPCKIHSVQKLMNVEYWQRG